MDIAGLQPQIWVSGIVIAVAAGIALFVDYLRGKNEKLREALVEMSVRREHDTRSNGATMPKPAKAKVTEAVGDKEEQQKFIAKAAENAASRMASERAPLTGGRRRNPNQAPPPESLPRLDEMNPREALSEWLNKRAAARAAHPEPVAVQTADPVPVPPTAAPPQMPKESGRPSVYIDEFLWESILTNTVANKHHREAPSTRFEIIQGGFPAGMQDESTLDRLLLANKPFTGLVISLGVNQNDGRAATHEDLLSVNVFVRSLLRAEDFACRSAGDEFLLLCPGEKGMEAKERLNQISERLWDFQLRGIGNFSLLFSWGDIQVENEYLSEAVASASERMHQTRRARKTVSLDYVSRKKVSVL